MNPTINHQPFAKVTRNHSAVILYIHGIMGSPIEFIPFAENLINAPIDYKAILLPGHGGSGRAFLKSNRHAWKLCIDQEVEMFVKRYKHVYLIGHSLGGLLALNAAIQFPISGIMLINTALRTRITFQQISLSLRVLLASKNSQDPLISTYRNSFSISLVDWWTIPAWLLPMADVLWVASETRKILPLINTPVFIYQSLKDETVHPISARLLKNSLINSKVKLTYFENSTHAFFEEKDRQLMMGDLTQLINGPNRSS